MATPPPLLPRMFVLEGTFLGFLGNDEHKPKSLILEVEQEQMAIKLPKELRGYARSTFKMGDRLRCIGSSQVDFKAGVIKLRAYQIFALPPAPTSVASDAVTALPPPIPSQPAIATAATKRSKILICRKSGCQKRGGRQIVAALEQVLHTYQLQDQVEIQPTGCQKRCSQAPNLTIMPGKYCYKNVNAKDLTALIEEHFCSPDAPHA
ncbi:MAG: (2Fe-2S) ferredoxin domain-containing protein [Leptolyngbyaceae cyanobacterium]